MKQWSQGQRDLRKRVVIEGISPTVDGGLHAVKRCLGDEVAVEADIFADGHDLLCARLLYRHASETEWRETEMLPRDNDRWSGSFVVDRIGEFYFSVEAWVDHFKTWRRDLKKKYDAGQDLTVDFAVGRHLLTEIEGRLLAPEKSRFSTWLSTWSENGTNPNLRVQNALEPAFAKLVEGAASRTLATRLPNTYRIVVDTQLARFGSWYELFPRSCGSEGKRHGTFQDLEKALPRIAKMGFDVVYLPPVHPIGESFRKGKNNRTESAAGEPGSPWAIGNGSGGHKAIHPELGDFSDFRKLVKSAAALRLSIALDIAFQCAPEHPYVREHPEWFKKRPDGAIQYAENPPKKYQDIYPFDFEGGAADELGEELKSVFLFWIQEGVTIFRVDNPHTKSFAFWEWVIAEVKQAHPETIFLAEAFTRPKVMYGLAKIGFSQSYNYFPWRNTSAELRQFMTEVAHSKVTEFYRPNLWPNTPDILPQYLQFGGRPAFIIRLILAATLGASYGIYGPAYELCMGEARALGEEEYLDSEKYELKAWDLAAPQNLEKLITQVNRIRRTHSAFERNDFLKFHGIDNEQLLIYSKRSADRADLMLMVVNLDPHHAQSGVTELALSEFGIGEKDTFQVHELLSDTHYLWRGSKNQIELDPEINPAAIFHVRRHVRTENDFDYYL